MRDRCAEPHQDYRPKGEPGRYNCDENRRLNRLLKPRSDSEHKPNDHVRGLGDHVQVQEGSEGARHW